MVRKLKAELAAQLPKLALPTMSEEARQIFRDILKTERPLANGSTKKYLDLARARGFSADARDWIPDIDTYAAGNPDFPLLYQPWMNWLADQGHVRFKTGVALTAENWHRWKPEHRRHAFGHLLHTNRTLAHNLLLTKGVKEPVPVRIGLLLEIQPGLDWGARFFEEDIKVIRAFGSDKSAKVRDFVDYKLEELNGLETWKAQARFFLKYLSVEDGKVIPLFDRQASATKDAKPYFQTRRTTFEALAEVLDLSPLDLAERLDVNVDLGPFVLLTQYAKDQNVRATVARRMRDAGVDCPHHLLKEIDPKAALKLHRKQAFEANQPGAVFDYLGDNLGHLEATDLADMHFYHRFKESVTAEIEDGTLPVNETYDSVRHMGLVLCKDAAARVYDEAIGLGMKRDNPRLQMLKFNLAL